MQLIPSVQQISAHIKPVDFHLLDT